MAVFEFKQRKHKLVARLFTRFPIFVNFWTRQAKFVEFSDSPWTPVTRPASQGRLALVTTGGIHLLSQAPFDMQDPSGDPTFREIPADARRASLTITHDYYDHADADKDINIVFPIERVLDLKKSGDIGEVNHRHFSFMGHITNRHIRTLMTATAPRVASALKADGVDIVVLTPAWGLCNQSVGLIQRTIEAAGMATISISLSEQITKKVCPPRAVYPGFPLGHPIAFPGQTKRQIKVLRVLLKYLEELDSPGSFVKHDMMAGEPVTLPDLRQGLK
jgi:D-proline reductase (dithiol) PrdB